ncbi:MAG: hypothetical protein OXG78_04915 [Chloroflexi bacterium]|nr:hypothetical protein [Chloroflexota bacterium]
MFRLQRILWLTICIIIVSACQGPGIAPEQQTATAESQAVAQHIATLGSIAATNTAIHVTEAVARAATEAAPTDTPTITPTPDPFPTPVKGNIYVAEQRFEGGRMFWLQPNGQIWLLSADEAGKNIWSVYNDTFVEGEVESDPQIVPPENRHQPVRGFGKLWRENLEVRQELGWALETEIGHTTRYEYRQGGHLNDQNVYVPGPGYHLLRSASGDTFRFDEGTFTWSFAG